MNALTKRTMSMMKYCAERFSESNSGELYNVYEVDAVIKIKDVLIERQQGQLAEQAAEIIHLTMRVEDADHLIADAERYRWLREQSCLSDAMHVSGRIYVDGTFVGNEAIFAKELDKAIDIARGMN